MRFKLFGKPAKKKWRQPSKDGRTRFGLRIIDEFRKFIAVDNHAAVKIGDLEKETRSKKVVLPTFTSDFPGAVCSERSGRVHLVCARRGSGAFFHRHFTCEKQEMESTARGRGLARHLPGGLQGSRRTGL